MSGSLSLSLSQRFDRNGRVLNGGKLYFYAANTTTPQNAYQDTALTLVHPNPITLDAYGNIPEFYLADGNIHFRLTDANGVVVLEAQNALVIGPSGGGGGGGSAVDPTAIFQTGDIIWLMASGARTGWVRLNQRTIGSATSGATERANSDTQALFVYLWTNINNSLAPVSGGRGASAAADFAANKNIGIPTMQGRLPIGADGMGGTRVNVLPDSAVTLGNGDFPSSFGGEATHTLTTNELAVTTANLANPNTYAPGSLHVTDNTNGSASAFTANPTSNTGTAVAGAGSGTIYLQPLFFQPPNFTPSGNVTFGGGAAHNNMPPFVVGTFYMKL